MGNLGFNEIAQVVVNSPFPPSEHKTAVAVAMAESGGNPSARPRNRNGTYDHGLFQINSVHKEILASGDWRNPNDNARMAYQVWLTAPGGGKNWNPWVVYKSRKYLLYLAQAAAALEGKEAGENPTNIAPESERGGSLAGLTNIVGFFTDTNNYVRVGMFLVGGLLLLFFVLRVTKIDTLAIEGAKLAVTKGAMK